MKRTVAPELLDSDAGTPREVRAALGDLGRVNRWFGGISTSESLLRRAIGELGLKRIDLLDVGSGSGDVPLAVARRLERDGMELRLTLLDSRATHLPPLACTVVGDALELPFASGSFDLVSCSLFAHHLDPLPLLRFVKEALRVTRFGLIINDLVRNSMHLGLLMIGRPLFRSSMAWHDGVVSVRRAYSEQEFRDMLQGASHRVEISRHYLHRIGIIIWK